MVDKQKNEDFERFKFNEVRCYPTGKNNDVICELRKDVEAEGGGYEPKVISVKDLEEIELYCDNECNLVTNFIDFLNKEPDPDMFNVNFEDDVQARKVNSTLIIAKHFEELMDGRILPAAEKFYKKTEKRNKK